MQPDKDVPQADIIQVIKMVEEAGFQTATVTPPGETPASTAMPGHLIIPGAQLMILFLSVVGLCTGLVRLIQYLKQKHRDREMRRITSLDT